MSHKEKDKPCDDCVCPPGHESMELWDPDAYKLEIEIDGNKFKFESPTESTLVNLGLDLLANTFGRYDADKLREKFLENSRKSDA